MIHPPKKTDVQEKDLSSWEEFEHEVRELPKLLQSWERPPLFRGQSSFSLPLETTLCRHAKKLIKFDDYYRVISKIKPQIESLTQHSWNIPEYREVEKLVKEYDAFELKMAFGPRIAHEYLAYLRHHGFPSPLLDWTRSPYIAAFFAFRNSSCAKSENVSIFVLSERPFKITGNNMAVVYRLGPYIKTHRRHHLQQCDYTICLRYDDEWKFEDYGNAFSGHSSQGILRKFNIPSIEREKVLRNLDLHNINAFSLFDSEDSLAETMGVREIQFGDWNKEG